MIENGSIPMMGCDRKMVNMLIVYSPRQLETQVIRPLVMDFTREAKAGMANAIGSELNKYSEYHVNAEMRSAVLPDATGLRIDSDYMGSLFTFLLITTEGGVTPIGIRVSSNKHLASGYFTEQPFSDQFLSGMDLNPVEAINPNAIMVFTDVSGHMYNGSITADAGQQLVSANVGSNGIYSNSLNSAFKRTDLCMMTPRAMVNTEITKTTPDHGDYWVPSHNEMGMRPHMDTESEEKVGMIDGEPPSSALVSAAASPVSIDNNLKAPTAQLNNMIDAITEANVMDADGCSINDSMLTHRSHYGSFVSDDVDYVVGMQAIGPEIPKRSGLIDYSQPLYVTNLFTTIPQLTTQYVKLNLRAQFDVVEQDIISPHTRMSSLATHVFSNICVDLGILNVSVGYASYSMVEGWLDVNQPQWFVEDVNLLTADVTQAQAEMVQRKMMILLENNLFSVIAYTCGAFEINMTYTVAGDALVRLKLMDFANYSEGYTTTPMGWGSAVSNIIGTKDHLVHNAVQLASVISDNRGTVPVSQPSVY